MQIIKLFARGTSPGIENKNNMEKVEQLQVVNVITIRNGLLEDVDSYIIMNKTDEKRQVAEAEKKFIELAISHGAKDRDVDIYLDYGSYDNEAGFEVIINWSNVYL